MKTQPTNFGFLFRFILPLVAISALLFISVGSFSQNTTVVRLCQNATREIFRIEAPRQEFLPNDLVEIYRNQVDERRKILKQVLGGAWAASDVGQAHQVAYANLYNVLAPEIFCLGLIRIGHVSDGGKWLCNPQMMPKPCAIYSLGINNEYSFETEIYSLTKCHIHGFDKDQMGSGTVEAYKRINATIMPAYLAKETNASLGRYSFSDIAKMHNHSKIDILKIDIEGGEYDVADQIVQVPICQILIELHGAAKQMMGALETFSKSGFYLFHHEINGGNLKASEFSLIHESCLKDYAVELVLGRYLS